MVRFNTGEGAPSWLNLKLRLISRVGNGTASDRVQRVRNRFLKEIRADRKWMNAGQHKYPPMWNQYSWLPSSGYKMYTFKISDSEPFPWQRRGWQFFYFLGFHWTTPENIIITQTERPILIIMISNREEKTWNPSQPMEESSLGAAIDVAAHCNPVAILMSQLLQPRSLCSLLKVGVGGTPTVSWAWFLKKCTICYWRLLPSCCPGYSFCLFVEVEEGISLSPKSPKSWLWC